MICGFYCRLLYPADCVCAFSFLFHISVSSYQCQLWGKTSHPSRVPQSTLYFLTLFCLCFISSLAVLLSPRHDISRKKKGLLNHFSEPKTKKRSTDALLTRSIWIDATCHCFKSVTVEVADLSAFGHNISSTHHIRPLRFSLKWQIIAKELLFLNTECSPSHFHTYTLMHTCIEIVSLNPVL